ncbi:MAG: hypothetical protein LAN61_10520 [Acidobacteriia bacterium]|nr:hypothetical protein [Terriglobia bacterium]
MTTAEAVATVRSALKGNTNQALHCREWIPPRIAEAMQYLADYAAAELLKPPTRPRRGRGGR